MSMSSSLIGEMDERFIAQQVGIPHDEAFMQYRTRSNTVGDIHAFFEIIGHYYQYHHSQCVSRGGVIDQFEARSQAKEIVTSEYKKRGGNINTAFNDAHDGTNGGLRGILSILADALKAKSVENHMRDAFDRHVAPNSWQEKVAIIRDFMSQCGEYLRADLDVEHPERYAGEYEELIRTYVRNMQSTSSVFRRM